MKTKIILFSIFLSFSAFLSAQTLFEKKGNQYFEKFNYLRAIENYTSASSLSLDSKRKLAESYRLSNQMEKAEPLYAELANEAGATKDDVYYYAYVLKENKKYDDSNLWMSAYKAKVEKDEIIKNFDMNKSKFNEINVDNGQFVVNNIDANSAEEDFGTSYYKDQVVFASSRSRRKLFPKQWSGNHKAFLDLMVADDEESNLINEKSFGSLMNKKYHEGPASFAKNGDFIAFTSNNYTGKSSDGTIKLKIFFSEFKEGAWSTPVPFYLNNDQYSVGHPYLTEDGNTMYFASDMAGGFGKADIYKVTRTVGAEWSQAENLGNIVNTEGNEMFPYLHEQQNLLLFSSDGQFGLGGLDIFVAPLKNGGFKTSKNLGRPINGERDDFALLLSSDATKGYFSSNRLEGKGDDDIYSFKMLKPFVFGKRLEGYAKDKKGAILPESKIYLFNVDNKIIDSTLADPNGFYSFPVEADTKYALKGTKKEYFDGKNSASTSTPDEVVKADLTLEKDPGLALYFLVTDKKSGEPIPNTVMTLTNKVSGETEILNLGQTADFLSALTKNKVTDKIEYVFKLEAPGYLGKTFKYEQVLDKPGLYEVHKALDIRLDQIVAGETKLEDLIQINPIYFDLNKDFIRKDAAKELDKIVQVMNENPTMEVELGSHTDCRATFKYNEALSDRRAKSSAKYIAAKIVNPGRIYGKGYGEAILLNSCACEGSVKSTCSEEEHQKNRRTEFRITKFDAPNTKVINTSPDSFEGK